MAYLDRPPLSRRLATLGTAGAIELGIAAVLIAGLSTNFVRVEEAPQLWGRNIPDDDPPPPPPKAEEPVKQDDSVITAPDPAFKLDPNAGDIPVTDEPPPFTGDVIEIPRDPPPYVPPSPARFTPVSAKPIGQSAGWVTTDDYPRRDLIAGNQGTTRFRVIVGTNGRVLSCEVTSPSGFPRLDKAACTNVTRRARFEPAKDENGDKVVGNYSSSVKWQIPD